MKTARVAEIADAIRRVAAGEMLIPAATLSALLRRARERAVDRTARSKRAACRRQVSPRSIDERADLEA